MSRSTTAGEIIDEAVARTGLSELGDDWFRQPLEAWAKDLEQANLSETGRRFLRSLAVRDVARRLRVLDTLRRHPEIADVAIPPIVYVTGLERSGTTLLHNALALHDGARALLRWELMEPVPPPTAEAHASDPRIAAVQRSLEPLRGSLLEHMHWVEATDPEECAWGFIDAVSMLGQAASFCMPAWRRFLGEADLTPAFAHYRSVVQLLSWRHPVAPDGFLVLKSPQIARQIGAFAAVFPEARFVVTDRDPFRALVSLAAMGASIVEPFCLENPLRRRAAEDVDVLELFRGKLAAVQTFSEAHPERCLHVPYPSLVADPRSTVEELVAALGLPADPAQGPRIDAFLAAQRAGRRAAPPPSIETLGYEHGAVLADPTVARYCEQFGIVPERQRLTGHGASASG